VFQSSGQPRSRWHSKTKSRDQGVRCPSKSWLSVKLLASGYGARVENFDVTTNLPDVRACVVPSESVTHSVIVLSREGPSRRRVAFGRLDLPANAPNKLHPLHVARAISSHATDIFLSISQEQPSHSCKKLYYSPLRRPQPPAGRVAALSQHGSSLFDVTID
jgi:hypothetical protein